LPVSQASKNCAAVSLIDVMEPLLPSGVMLSLVGARRHPVRGP
jgi:hypothetical protein